MGESNGQPNQLQFNTDDIPYEDAVGQLFLTGRTQTVSANNDGKYPKSEVTAELFTPGGRWGVLVLAPALPRRFPPFSTVTKDVASLGLKVTKAIFRWKLNLLEEASFTRRATSGNFLQSVTISWGTFIPLYSDEPSTFVVEEAL